MQISDAKYVHSSTVADNSAPVAAAELRMWASLGRKKKKKKKRVCMQGYKGREAPLIPMKPYLELFSNVPVTFCSVAGL